MTEISQRVQKALNYIETKEPSKIELINFFNQVNKDEKITDHEREILIEAVEKQMRIKFHKSAKKILGGKSAKAQELLQEIYSLLIKEFDCRTIVLAIKLK